MEQYKNYAKHIGGDDYLIKWIETVLKNAVAKEPKTTEEVEHVLDYLVQCGKNIQRMSYKDAKRLSDAWLKTQIKKGNNIKELPEDTEIVLDFKDGFKVVKLIGENAYKREGFLMSHCVGSYYGRDVEIYSLRDKDNIPHCTMEKDQQIKGKGNGDIHPKYILYVVKFLEHVGMTVGDSEMKHLGYINVEEFKEDLHQDTKYFNDKYILNTEKMLDKKGNEYFSPELFSIKPLLEYTDNKLKVNFSLISICKLSFEWIQSKAKVKKGVSATTGDSAHSATTGNSAHSATTGNSAHSATTGYSAHSATTGYSAHSATTGDSAHSATTGDFAHSATTGNSAHSATTGYSAHSATTGHSAHSATTGDSAHSATTGNSAHSATTGDSAHSATTGENSIACGLGINNKAKASLGEWIVLSEWKQDKDSWKWNISSVKTAKIDGKTLKPDTWYVLKNGKFRVMQIKPSDEILQGYK